MFKPKMDFNPPGTLKLSYVKNKLIAVYSLESTARKMIFNALREKKNTKYTIHIECDLC